MLKQVLICQETKQKTLIKALIITSDDYLCQKKKDATRIKIIVIIEL